jgi:peroxiredoxin
MAKITLKGNPVNTSGVLPAKGTGAPDFMLVNSDLGIMTLSELKGKKIVVIDETGKVVYTQLVPEIATEPDYDGALAAL